MAPEIRAVILKKLCLDEKETICCVSGESIAVEAAIAVRRGHVVAVEYKPGDRQTMEENVVRFGLNNVLIVDDMESYSHRWPVPDVAFLVASPKLELELQTLVQGQPEDSGGDLYLGVQFHEPDSRDALGKRHPAHGGDAAGGLQGGPEGRDRGAAGALDFLWPGGAGITHKKRALFREKRGICALTRPRPVRIISSIKQSQSQWR